MLEQEGSLSSLCTDAEKERGLLGEHSAAAAAAAETAIESMLERTTGSAVHISTDYRGCSEHCVIECTDIMSSLSGQLCINQLEEKKPLDVESSIHLMGYGRGGESASVGICI